MKFTFFIPQCYVSEALEAYKWLFIVQAHLWSNIWLRLFGIRENVEVEGSFSFWRLPVSEKKNGNIYDHETSEFHFVKKAFFLSTINLWNT